MTDRRPNKGKGAIQFLDEWLDRITRACWVFAGAMIIVMAFDVGYGVFTRYVLRRPSPYTYETTSILMLAIVFLAIAYTQRIGHHLRVDLMDRHFPEAVREFLANVVSPLIGLVFCGVVTWQSWEVALATLRNHEVTTNLLVLPTFPLRMLVIIGTGLLCIVLLVQILRYFVSLKTKPPL